MASWGEMQTGNSSCIIAVIYNPVTKVIDKDPYIIGEKEFNNTYELG